MLSWAGSVYQDYACNPARGQQMEMHLQFSGLQGTELFWANSNQERQHRFSLLHEGPHQNTGSKHDMIWNLTCDVGVKSRPSEKSSVSSESTSAVLTVCWSIKANLCPSRDHAAATTGPSWGASVWSSSAASSSCCRRVTMAAWGDCCRSKT